MENETNKDLERNESTKTTELPGLTATMEIAGVESIPGANPDRIVLGFAREQ